MKLNLAHLTQRERLLIYATSGFVVICVVYFFMMQPWLHRITALEDSINSNMELIKTLQQEQAKIATLQTKQEQLKINNTQSIFLIIEESLKDYPALANAIKEQSQQEENIVKISFNHVAFDYLVKWLWFLASHKGLVISDLTLKKAVEAGYVDTTLTLKKIIFN